MKLSVMDIASMWPSPLPTTLVVELWPFGVVHMQCTCAYVVFTIRGSNSGGTLILCKREMYL